MTPPHLNEAQRLALLEGVFQTLDGGAIVVDREFTILLANAWAQSRSNSTTAVEGQKCFAALFGAKDRCQACVFLRSIQTGKAQRQVVKATAGDGAARWFELAAYPLRDPAGAVAGDIEHMKDITPQRQLEEQMRNESVRRKLLLYESRDGIAMFDLEGRVVETNEQYASILGYTTEELHQLHIWDWDTNTERGRLLYMLETAGTARDRFETSYRRKNGTPVQVEVHTSGAFIDGRTLVLHVCRDVTEKKEMQKQVKESAVRDPRTGVYNGRYIFDRLTQLAAEYRRGKSAFCISLLEVDNLESVRESHRHTAVEHALTGLAQTLGRALRRYDLLGLYAGEGFILVSRNATVEETAAMIERIIQMVHQTDFSCEGHRIRFTLSGGTAHSSEFTPEAFDMQAMVARAETRRREARAFGGDRYIGPLNEGHAAPVAPGPEGSA